MLKRVQRHPILWACAFVAIASLLVMVFFGFDSEPAFFAVFPLVIAGSLAMGVMNYLVFSSGRNSTVYRHRADPDDDAH